ncbi:MAG: UDP-N-acetylglucosamine--N-acetylmuramyl-(pentapeptide) pyrophosphoryl-undecaprenol N-acetylglucosamine transferase [Candidatus Tumulicola sp.]
MRVVFAAGGTGGHIYPALAIAGALRERFDATIDFVGTSHRLEARIVPAEGYRLHTVSAQPMFVAPKRTLVNAFANAWGVTQSARLLRRLEPDVVIATGGYVCFPVVAAAALLRRTGLSKAGIAMLEPNAAAGLTSRVTARWVDEVWGPFAGADAGLAGKYVRTAVPVRPGLRQLPGRARAAAAFGLDPAKPILFAMGGSQGARSLNDALVAGLRAGAFPDWQAIVVTGDRDFDTYRTAERPGVKVRPYLDDPAPAYAAADLVLARAGASTLAELAAVGKPAVLVPYPFAAADHQTSNAVEFEKGGAATVVSDRDVRDGGLIAALRGAMETVRLADAASAARRMATEDPLAGIAARVERLASRTQRA